MGEEVGLATVKLLAGELIIAISVVPQFGVYVFELAVNVTTRFEIGPLTSVPIIVGVATRPRLVRAVMMSPLG